MRADPIPGTVEERRGPGEDRYDGSPRRGPGEDRLCADPTCRAPLVRATHPDGRLEYPGHFQRRLYCGRVCYFRARQSPARQERESRRLVARLERAQARQEAEASRLLTRPQQAARLEAELRATDLWRDLPAPQYDTLRLLAALCWKYRGLAAAREFIDSVAWTVRAAGAAARSAGRPL